jgi:FlaA1/EpsC-like NDP-sugar epimerase/lipopolysaccharide/colanic/teichoic acid biosynthesis glycosyltransferase
MSSSKDLGRERESGGIQADPAIERRLGVRSEGLQPLALRILDIVISLSGLLLVSPLFPIIGFLIKFDAKGPIIYPTERIGKDRKPFLMYKFRTMLDCSTKIDQSVCPQYDPRVTTIGRFLRRTKLNELPQLFNVLRGEMSFVGPRPEAPDLASMYPEEAKRILLAKPGLVGPAVIPSLSGGINGRNEEEMYPRGADPKQYYIEHILPEKVKIDLYYLSRQTIASYFRIIYLAAKETVVGAFSAGPADTGKRSSFMAMADLSLSMISYTFGWLVFFRWSGRVTTVWSFLTGFLLVLAARPLLFYLLGFYNVVMELLTPRDIYRLVRGIFFGTLLMLIADRLISLTAYPLMVAAIDFGLLSVMLAVVRFYLMSRYRHLGRIKEANQRPRALIFGANPNGLKALYTLGGSKTSPFRIVGFVDDAEAKFGKTIRGVKVLGNRHHIQALSVLYNVREVILAPHVGARNDIDEIVAQCVQAGVRSRLFSPGRTDDESRPSSYPLRPVHLSDILPPVPVQVDTSTLRSLVTGKTVLLFGSGGELGSAICRSLFQSGCRKLVIVDPLEHYLSDILTGLRGDLPGFRIIPAVLDSLDAEALNGLFARHKPQIVIHAGMRKYLNLGSVDYDEVARANYLRTFNLARAASAHRCQFFVLISSMKAASRGNFISNSLRVAEISLNSFFVQTGTSLIVARVGNIIENRGGIVSWLNDQIVDRQVLRLPSKSARTFLLSKNAAARAVLQALVMGSKVSRGGSLLTSELGAFLRLEDVARKIANLYGLTLGRDIALKFGEIPDGIVDDEPVIQMATNLLDVLPDLDRPDPMLERLISGGGNQKAGREWDRETTQLIAQFDETRFSLGGRATSN